MNEKTKKQIGNFFIWFGAIVLVLMIIGAIFGTSSQEEEVKKSGPDFDVVEKNVQKNIEQNIANYQRNVFLDGCMGEGANIQYCNCAFDRILDTRGMIVFEQMEYMTEKQVEEVIVDAILHCVDEI